MTYPLVIKCGNGQCSTNGGVPTWEYQLFLMVDFPASHGEDNRKGLPDSLQGF